MLQRMKSIGKGLLDKKETISQFLQSYQLPQLPGQDFEEKLALNLKSKDKNTTN